MIPLILMGDGRPGLAFDEGYSAQRLAGFLGFASPMEMRAVVALHNVGEFETPEVAWRFVADCGVTHLMIVGLKTAKFMRTGRSLGRRLQIPLWLPDARSEDFQIVHVMILPHPSGTSRIWNDVERRRYWTEQYRRFYEEAKRSDFIEAAGIVR